MKELIQLKKLTKDNTSKNYINWLKDESTIRYTQQNFSKPTKKNQLYLQKKIKRMMILSFMEFSLIQNMLVILGWDQL